MNRGRPKKQKSHKLAKENQEQISTEQQDNLRKIINELEKKFGKGVIHFATDERPKDKIALPVKELNDLTGGGIQCGSFSIIWGNKAVAKTTLAFYLIADAQKQEKQCIYFAIEPGFDKKWAEKCGIQLDKLLIVRPKTAEEAMDTLIKLSKEKVIDFAVIDSIQALSPEGEQQTKKGKEKSVADDTMALLARKLSLFFRMCARDVYRGNVAVLLIGQARTDLGGFFAFEKLSGGHALEHWSALTLKAYRGTKADAPRYKFKIIDKKGKKKTKEIIIGFNLSVKVEKTKISGTRPEGSEIKIPFYYEYGFKKPTDIQIEKLYSFDIECEKDIEEND